MAIEESVPSCNMIIVPTPLHKYTQNIQTHIYIQISMLQKTNMSTCSHIRLHAHTCMHVRASKTYTYIYTHIMIVTPKYRKYTQLYICDRAWENWVYLHILYFEKYEFEILDALFFSWGAIQSRQIYYINSVVI